MPREEEGGPRLEKRKHRLAEQRLRHYFERLSHDPTFDYPGREEDIQLIKRKHRELNSEQLRRAVWGEG